MRKSVLLSTVLCLTSCGVQYVPEKRGQGYVFKQDPFVSAATVDLENRGHTYKADVGRTWRAVHNTLGRMGVRIKRKDDAWHHIDNTEYATTPRGEIAGFIRDLNKRNPDSQVVSARYRLTVSLMEEGHQRTTVIVRVFPEIQQRGSKQWFPIPNNRRFIEYFYRTLDHMLPVYRDDSLPMWKGW